MNPEFLNARTAYFDESHTHSGAPFPLVAGFISQDDRWLLFSQEWNRTLTEFGVSCFHMREFAHSQGEFKTWKGDTGRQASFMDSLITTIERHVEYAWSVSVDEHAFQQYRAYLGKVLGPVPRKDRVPWDSAYEFTGYTACVMVNASLQEHWRSPPGFPIRIVFDQGNPDKRYLAKGYSAAYRFNPAFGEWGMPPEIRFENSKRAAPLQAADLLAWETGKYSKNARRGQIKFRRSFWRLARLRGWSQVVTGPVLRDFERYYLNQTISNAKLRAAL